MFENLDKTCFLLVTLPTFECHIWSKAEFDELHGIMDGDKAQEVCERIDGRVWSGGIALKAPGCDTNCNCCRPGSPSTSITIEN